jgi:hypothetical protein
MSPSIKTHIADLYGKFQFQIHNLLYLVFITAIVYVSQIPECYRKYGNNFIVRALLFGSIVLVNNYISYIHALLLALFVVLFISFTPGIESFEDLRIVAKKEQRWYDEQVLGEDPELMETEKVQTQAVQSS